VKLEPACWRTSDFKDFFIREGLVPRPFETDALFAGWLVLGPNGEACILRLSPAIYARLFDSHKRNSKKAAILNIWKVELTRL
jgi:hypothetical protein